MEKYFAICSNPKCNLSLRYTIGQPIPHRSYCERCTSDLIYECPNCRNLFVDKYARSCGYCKTVIKPELQKEE